MFNARLRYDDLARSLGFRTLVPATPPRLPSHEPGHPLASPGVRVPKPARRLVQIHLGSQPVNHVGVCPLSKRPGGMSPATGSRAEISLTRAFAKRVPPPGLKVEHVPAGVRG